MNHCVPNFEMDDNYSIPTSSGLIRPKKSTLADEEIMELLWQNGSVVVQNQSQRSLRKYHIGNNNGNGIGNSEIYAEQLAVREMISTIDESSCIPQNIYMQEDEMSSWLHRPLLEDPSFDRDLYADLLYTTQSVAVNTTASAAAEPQEFHDTMAEILIGQSATPTQPSASPFSLAPLPPQLLLPMPPLRCTDEAEISNQFHNFGCFPPLSKSTLESGPSNSSKIARESMVLDSDGTLNAVLESKALHVPGSGAPVTGGNIGDGGTMCNTAVAATSTAGREFPTTCDQLNGALSPGGSRGSASNNVEPSPLSQKPAPPSSVVEDRKRKGIEADQESHSEDVDFECADGKKQARSSTSTKRSRAAEVHNLSERRRRDRINEKMKALQELIPRCNKSDKASMLDEAIEYLKSLQLQVQMMSMGCSMAPMMYPGMQQYMPTMGMNMGMGMEMGMNRPMVPYPTMLPGSAMQTAAAVAQMGSRFTMPAFPMPPVPIPDQSRIQASNQPNPMLSSLAGLKPIQPRLPNFGDPYKQFYGLHQAKLALPQNHAVQQRGSTKHGICKVVGSPTPRNHRSG